MSTGKLRIRQKCDTDGLVSHRSGGRLGLMLPRPRMQEHLASVRGLEEENVKDAIKSFLRTSGNALKLQNLAYALKHGLVLPFDAAPGQADVGLTGQVFAPLHTSTVTQLFILCF